MKKKTTSPTMSTIRNIYGDWSCNPALKVGTGKPVLGETSFTVGNIKVTSKQRLEEFTKTIQPDNEFNSETGKKNKPIMEKCERLVKMYYITQGNNIITLTDDEYGVFEDMIGKGNVICDAENDDTYNEED